jgi:glycosyltransferase involved in cell wall biosynthesis
VKPSLAITIALGPFYPTPPAPTGAVQRIWSDLADEFARRGHKVTILACRHDGQPAEETRNGVTIRRRTGLRQGKNVYRDILKDSWYSLRSLALMPPADVVVSNAFWFPVFAALRQRRRGRLIVHVARAPKGQLRFYKGAACFDTPSEAIREQILAEAPWAASRTKVVPYPINTEVFTPPSPPPASPPDRSRSGNGTLTLLYTGRIHPEKGVHVLVDAYSRVRKQFPALTLRLVGAQRVNEGGAGDDYIRDLRAKAAGLPIAIDAPIYDRHGLAAALQQADFYCYPSLAEKGETFGVAPLEAMATGLAPIVSNLACFNQFMIDGATGHVFDHRCADPAGALAAKLTALASDMTTARRMGEAAAARAREFSYAAIAEHHLRDFQRLVEGRP